MAISLYDLTVPTYLQGLAGLAQVLRKAAEHEEAQGRDPNGLVEARIIEDMFPLKLQVQRAADHSAGALRDVSQGAFTMPTRGEFTYAELEALVADTIQALEGWRREDVEALEGRPVLFNPGSMRMDFTAEAFLLSFSIPSFYFHLVTAYDILRMKGAPIGKMDYLKQMRTTLSPA